MKTLFVDTETTGADQFTCGLWQIAGIVDIDGEAVEEFNILCDIYDDDKIEPGAFLVNKMTLEKIHTFPSPNKAYLDFLHIVGRYVNKFDKADKFAMVGFGAEFDNQMLRRLFLRNGDNYFGSWFWHPWIDIMSLAMYVFQDKRHEMENFKLATVAKFAGIPVKDEKMHDALEDIRITRQLYYNLIQ